MKKVAILSTFFLLALVTSHSYSMKITAKNCIKFLRLVAIQKNITIINTEKLPNSIKENPEVKILMDIIKLKQQENCNLCKKPTISYQNKPQIRRRYSV